MQLAFSTGRKGRFRGIDPAQLQRQFQIAIHRPAARIENRGDITGTQLEPGQDHRGPGDHQKQDNQPHCYFPQGHARYRTHDTCYGRADQTDGNTDCSS